jgi:hypothetical protein
VLQPWPPGTVQPGEVLPVFPDSRD